VTVSLRLGIGIKFNAVASGWIKGVVRVVRGVAD